GTAPTGTEVDHDPAAALDHHRNEMPDNIGDTLDIHIDDQTEFLGTDLPERRIAVDDAGVIQHQVRCGARFEQSLRPRLDLFVGSHVHTIEQMPSAKASPQFGEVLFRTAATEHHMAEPDKFLRHG